MSMANAQILAIPKRLFFGIPISRRPYCVYSPQFSDDNIFKRLFSGIPISRRPQFTDDSDKFAFLDTVDDSPWPAVNTKRFEVFIERSYLKGDATEQEKMDFYVKTAAHAVGSEEEAKERIYKVSRDCSFCAFGFEMCFDVAYEFHVLDSVEKMDLESTGQKYMNGEMVRWSLKPKKRVEGRFPLPKPKLKLESGSEDFDSDEA